MGLRHSSLRRGEQLETFDPWGTSLRAEAKVASEGQMEPLLLGLVV